MIALATAYVAWLNAWTFQYYLDVNIIGGKGLSTNLGHQAIYLSSGGKEPGDPCDTDNTVEPDRTKSLGRNGHYRGCDKRG